MAGQDSKQPFALLVLEPSLWRFLGLFHVLSATPGISFLGEEDYNKILALRQPPKDLKPDVVMLSSSLLVDFRLSLLERIKDLFPRSNVLTYGYDARIDWIADVLAAGANGYFLLTSRPEELIEALELVRKGLMCGPPEAVALLVARMRRRKGEQVIARDVDVVAPYELSLLRMLKEGKSNKEIAAQLGVAEVTVKSHLARLYRRFTVRTRLQLLAYALDHNLIASERARDKSAS